MAGSPLFAVLALLVPPVEAPTPDRGDAAQPGVPVVGDRRLLDAVLTAQAEQVALVRTARAYFACAVNKERSVGTVAWDGDDVRIEYEMRVNAVGTPLRPPHRAVVILTPDELFHYEPVNAFAELAPRRMLSVPESVRVWPAEAWFRFQDVTSWKEILDPSAARGSVTEFAPFRLPPASGSSGDTRAAWSLGSSPGRTWAGWWWRTATKAATRASTSSPAEPNG